MKAWLRQHGYAFAITLRRLAKQPFSSLANLLVMALALALPVLGAALLVSAQPLVREISVTPDITVFIKMDAQADAAETVARRIRSELSDQVSAVRVVTRGDALVELRRQRDWDQALAMLPDNPLPDAVVVTLAPGDDLAARARAQVDVLAHWEHVDSVKLDSDWVQRLEALLRFGTIGLIFLASGVMMVVLATVFNTVRMQALSQREEIAVARLVGATEGFVRRPFLYLGALTCGVSALAAIAIASLALRPLQHALAAFARSYGTEFALHLPDAGVLAWGVFAAAVLGALSARWPVTRNTRF